MWEQPVLIFSLMLIILSLLILFWPEGETNFQVKGMNFQKCEQYLSDHPQEEHLIIFPELGNGKSYYQRNAQRSNLAIYEEVWEVESGQKVGYGCVRDN